MKTIPSVLLATLAALLWVVSSSAVAGELPYSQSSETITVTTCNDVSDFSGSQQVSDLPGPDGRVSFREACTAANNTAGGQTIAFAIPVADFWGGWTTVALLKLEQNAFFLTDSATTVDFSTQTANIGDTNPTGPEVGIYGLQPNGAGVAAIFVKGDNCVIKGLGLIYQRGYGVELVGDNNRVIGSQITGAYNAGVNIEGSGATIPTGNIVGGTAPGEGNYLTGLTIRGPAENNIVIGNTIIGGVDVIGSTQYGVIVRNNRIGGPTPAERNVISGAGHYGEEGYPDGEQVTIVDADGTIIEGNYIGTTVDGMARYPQQIGPVGVEVRDSRATTIRGNLIAGLRTVGTNHYSGQIFGQAVYVGATNASTYDTVIEGNTIGLAADGVTPIVTRSGITVSPMSSNYHAFGTQIASNHIAGVETTAVVIGSQENGVTITGNSIHDSGGLGIDLFYNFNGIGGVTLNDPGDGDTGGNGLQNFPVLQSAATSGSAVMVQGTLDSSPSAQFMVEFFASPSCDPSGFGEGAAFIGSTPVTTDGMGHAAFSLTLPAAVAVGTRATATATRLSTGDTSEFSACVAVTSAVQVVSVVSRKTHGGLGAFDINLPLTGSTGIECRSGGANSDYQVVFTFPTAVTLSGASVTPAAGKSGRMAGQPNLSPDGKTVTIDLTNVADVQTIAVTLSGVSNGTNTNDVTVQMSLLVGDTSGNGVVNGTDVSQTKSQSGQTITNANFRSDVAVNGAINASDLALVKSRSGGGAP
jgi:titin